MGRERGLEGGVSARLSAQEGRRFGVVVGVAFLLLGLVLLWRSHQLPAAAALAAGGLLAIAGLLIPTRLGPVHAGWMAFAFRLSKVTTPLFMGAVYYVVLTPIGACMRLVGYRPLRHRAIDGSYWVSRSGESGRRSDLHHQF